MTRGGITVLGAVITLIGCTTLTQDQQATLAYYREQANKVTAAYGVGKVYFLVGAHNSAAGGTMRVGGLMTMEAGALDHKDDVLVAHELGHWVLNHPGRPSQSLEDRYRQEMDANAEAVKILTMGWEWNERRAYAAVLNRLWRGKRAASPFPTGILQIPVLRSPIWYVAFRSTPTSARRASPRKRGHPARNYGSAQKPWASTPRATLNLLRLWEGIKSPAILRSTGLQIAADRGTIRNPAATN